jgi:excinuclease ABC subunit A
MTDNHSTDNNAPLAQDFIEVIGAKVHNLKNIDVRIPRNQLVVITGISGSGKSSLAFDTIYAEGQRRYMETFSSYARQFIGTMERPDVEQITGLSPVISIEQKTTGRNPRSTVGTITEIYDFMRLLFARIGEAYSYETGEKMVKYTDEQIQNHIFDQFDGKKIMLLAPLVRGRKGHYRELFDGIRKQGYTKVRVDGVLLDLEPGLQVDRFKVHDIEVVIDRLVVSPDKRDRLISSLGITMKMGNGLLFILEAEDSVLPSEKPKGGIRTKKNMEARHPDTSGTEGVEDLTISNDNGGKVTTFSKHLMDAKTGLSYEEPSPNTFSFNSPYGACPHCKGLGQVAEVDMARVIPDRTKNLNDVAIVPFGEVRENTTFQQLRAIAKKYNFTFSTPINDIPQEAMNIILFGGEKKTMTLPNSVPAQDMYAYDLASTGLANMLKKWYEDTSSEKIATWAEEFMTVVTCSECEGFRLKKESLNFKITDKHIGDLAAKDVVSLAEWFGGIDFELTERQRFIAKDILKEIRLRIGFLLHVGLDYLSMNRPAGSLSGGESQRIRLATQIGSQLTGITYILDEPSIGLHQRDNQRLIEALQQLRDIGNTIIVVEHDKDIMLASDYLMDLGPGAGKHGGELVGQGIPAMFLKNETLTAEYLNNVRRIEVPKHRRKGNGKHLILRGATGHNLKNVNIDIPLGTLTVISGVSGSGKSTLINETLYPILRQHFYNSTKKPMPYATIEGLEHLDKVIEIDQSPIGRTPRSNPATYTGVFSDIRNIYAGLPEAKIRGYKPGRFSFNVKGGRCETCEGGGRRVIEMNFLPDVEVDCETCMGRRYNRETLEVLYKGKSINDVLNMTVEEATTFFDKIPNIYRKMRTLDDVGLGYITLGQQATTLSGGEAQRVKLAEELSKKDTGNTMYILDEPTTGLHFEDIQHLLNVIYRLVDKGNTVIIIEHNMDVIKVADYVVDMGPEGGFRGGEMVVCGTPEKVAKTERSHTGVFLKMEL